MLGRRVGPFLTMFAFAVCADPAFAIEKYGWNGVWTGLLGDTSKISVTIADNKVTNYSYRGAHLNVSYNKIADDTLSFGDGANYAMSLKKTGDGTAKATYHGRHGFVAAALTKQ